MRTSYENVTVMVGPPATPATNKLVLNGMPPGKYWFVPAGQFTGMTAGNAVPPDPSVNVIAVALVAVAPALTHPNNLPGVALTDVFEVAATEALVVAAVAARPVPPAAVTIAFDPVSPDDMTRAPGTAPEVVVRKNPADTASGITGWLRPLLPLQL
jgi:hypothetical protein